MQDFSSLPVVVPTIEEQKKIVANQERITNIYKEIDELENQAQKLKKEYWSLRKA